MRNWRELDRWLWGRRTFQAERKAEMSILRRMKSIVSKTEVPIVEGEEERSMGLGKADL